MKRYFVYILASQRNGTLYIGSTSNLIQRIWQHKNNIILGFTAKYHVHQLVYYEEHQNLAEMARREKRLKNWCRKWKLNLIEKFNPAWRDLYEEINA
jgi:putative endonuclease